MNKPFRTLGSGLPIEERLRQAEFDRDMWRGLHSDLEDQANQVALENKRLREALRSAASYLAYYWTGVGAREDSVDNREAWVREWILMANADRPDDDSNKPGA